jgi:hypothetical protein
VRRDHPALELDRLQPMIRIAIAAEAFVAIRGTA